MRTTRVFPNSVASAIDRLFTPLSSRAAIARARRSMRLSSFVRLLMCGPRCRRIATAAVVVCVAGILGAQPCAAMVINFASLGQSGGGLNNLGASLSLDGFTFTGANSAFGVGGDILIAWQASNLSHPVGGIAATSLTPYYGSTYLTITSNSGAFSLQSVDLAQWGFDQLGQLGNTTFSVVFQGVKEGGAQVSQTFTVANTSGSPVLSTFDFAGFTDLKQVSVQEGFFANGAAWQLNNLVTGVPEPSTWAMMLIGFACAGIAGYRASRRTNVVSVAV